MISLVRHTYVIFDWCYTGTPGCFIAAKQNQYFTPFKIIHLK